MVETEFRNVDLELESASDLSPLTQYFGDRVFVLFSGHGEEGFRLELESSPEYATADDTIQHFIALVSELPRPLRQLWDECASRVFDIGVQTGTSSLPFMPFTQILSEATIERIASIHAAVRMTIYPFPSPAKILMNSGPT